MIDPELIEIALKSDVCQPKHYAIPHQTNTEPNNSSEVRREVRTVGKDDINITKACGECNRKIKKIKKSFMCKCKEVLYCSYDCKQSSYHEGCQGEVKKNLFEDFDPDSWYPGKERIQKLRAELSKKCKDPRKMLKLAEEGDSFAAWLIGSQYSTRVVTFPGIKKLESIPNKSVAETDEIAMKWFLAAAEGGLPEGMVSLGRKMYAKNGLKTDCRVAYYWLAKALASGIELEEETIQLLESEPMLAKDIGFLTNFVDPRLRGGSFKMIKPNLSGLVLAARYEDILKWDGKTFNGGVFYGFNTFLKLNSYLNSNKIDICFVAGRAGSTPIVTRMNIIAERSVTNIKFRQGEKGTKDNGGLLDLEQISKENPDAWYTRERSKYEIVCTHHGAQEIFRVGECTECLDDAIKRTTAAAAGFFSISITETVPEYGYGARYYTVNDGNLILETFKNYSKPEICCVLQCLMSNPADLHPLHVADDPNLFWPVIWFYGSIYNALLECCGTNTVKKIYGKLSKYRTNKLYAGSSGPSSLAVFPSSAIGEMRMACGHETCPNLDHNEKFQKCTGCYVRYYCNKECLKADWSKHKTECNWGKEKKKVSS